MWFEYIIWLRWGFDFQSWNILLISTFWLIDSFCVQQQYVSYSESIYWNFKAESKLYIEKKNVASLRFNITTSGILETKFRLDYSNSNLII